MSKIVIDLRQDRTEVGTIHIENNDGNLMIGPFAALCKADTITASDEGNSSCDPKQLYGDTPLGEYQVIRIDASPSGQFEDYGSEGVLELEAISGDALEAKDNGRTSILIHAGNPDFEGNLQPTNGSVRMFNPDIKQLIDTIKINSLVDTEGNVKELKVEILEEAFPFTLMSDSADDGDPPLFLTNRAYTIRSRDTLSEIAEVFYGSTGSLNQIVEANRDIISDPDIIFPGQVLEIPNVSYPLMYRIRSDDTLSEIAAKFYGDDDFFDLILDANRSVISDPNLIFAGQEILIP